MSDELELTENVNEENIVEESIDVKQQLMNYFSLNDLDADDELSIQRLTLLIQLAERKVIKKRFPFGYTSEQRKEALSQYEDVIVQVVMRDFAKIGAEGESSHDENGTSRQYLSDDELFNEIVPICKIV